MKSPYTMIVMFVAFSFLASCQTTSNGSPGSSSGLSKTIKYSNLGKNTERLFGGGLSLRTAQMHFRSGYINSSSGFAAHVGFYPGCRFHPYTAEFSGAPILILTGSMDDNGDGKACPPPGPRL